MTAGKGKQVSRGAYDWLQVVVCSVLAVVILFTFVVRIVRVDGGSMRETLQDRDLLLMANSWLCGEYRFGDIVVLAKPEFENGDPVVKRVIATGGQTVDIDFDAGIVYVDGAVLEESYIREPTWTPEGLEFPITLQENEIFVMGDNRNDSRDSRDPSLGAVDTRYVMGRAVGLLFPGETVELERREWSRIIKPF